MDLLQTISSLIEKYGADASLEDVLQGEQQLVEHHAFLEAIEEDMQYMSEAVLRSMLKDPKTSADCLELIQTELSQRPRKTAIRMALLDRARFGAFHVPSFYDSPEVSQAKRDAFEAHKKVMHLRDYKDMEKEICVYENHRRHSAVLELFAMIDRNRTEYSRFHKEVVALVLARILRTWWPSSSLPLNYSPAMLDNSTLEALSDFLRETASSDPTVVRDIVDAIHHNVQKVCSRCGSIEVLLMASRDFKADPVCHAHVSAALALALRKLVDAVGIDPETNRVYYNKDNIASSQGQNGIRPILVHKLKVATHLADEVREVLAFFPNTDRIGEAFCKTRKRNVVALLPN